MEPHKHLTQNFMLFASVVSRMRGMHEEAVRGSEAPLGKACHAESSLSLRTASRAPFMSIGNEMMEGLNGDEP